MTLTHQALDRGLHWLACSVVALLLLVGVALQISTPTAYPPALLAAAALALGGALAWSVVDGRPQIPGRAGLRALVVVGAAVLVLHFPGGYSAGQPGVTPAMVPPIIGAGLVSGMAFSPTVGAAVGVLIGVGVAWTRREDLAVLDLVIGNAALVVTLVLAAYAVHVVHGIARALEQALAATWHEQESVARATQKAVEAVRWDGLVHDKVLGSLLAAGRGGPTAAGSAAAVLARDALAAMGAVEEAQPTTTGEVIRATADRLRLALKLDLKGALGDPFREAALLGAVEQALANVAHHSGQRSVTVRGTLGPHGGVVTVTDPGRGFDTSRERWAREGIDTGILRRMAAAGGHARISSDPGRGTTVRLTFRAPDARQAPAVKTWNWSNVMPLAVVGLVSLSLHLVMAVAYAGAVRSLPLLALEIAVALSVTVSLLLVPARRLWTLRMLAVIVALLPAVGTLNLLVPGTASWHYWFAGAMNTAVGTLVIRVGPLWGVPTAFAIPVGVAAVQGARGGVSWAVLLDVTHVLVVVAAAAWLLHRTLDLAASEVNRAWERVGRLRVVAAQAEEAEVMAAARTENIGDEAWNMLRLVASGAPLSCAQRRECLALEAAARDGLVAAPILTTRLHRQLREARAGGTRVDVSVDRAGPGIEALGRLLGIVLEQVDPGSEIRATWRPDRTGRLGTITVLRGPGRDAPLAEVSVHELAEQAGLADAGVRMEISMDEDAALLQVRAGEARTAGASSTGTLHGSEVLTHTG